MTNLDYRLQLYKLNDYSFDSIRQLSCRRLSSLGCVSSDNGLYQSLDRGMHILETQEQVDKYVQAFGKKHYVKFKALFETIPKKVFENYFDVVDWGCGAGLGVIALNDFCRNKLKREINSKVRNLILIEPSAVALQRAKLHGDILFGESNIVCVQKRFEDLQKDDQLSSRNIPVPRLHIFSNVFDLVVFNDEHNWLKFISLIKEIFSKDEIFLCCSPSYGQVKNVISRFAKTWEDDSCFEVSEILRLEEKIFTKEGAGSDVKMTAAAIKVINIKAKAKLLSIINWQLIDQVNQYGEFSETQNKLVGYVSQQCNEKDYDVLFKPNLMGDEPDLLILKEFCQPWVVYSCDIEDVSCNSLTKLLKIIVTVNNCKSSLYSLLSHTLRDIRDQTKNAYSIVKCVIYLPALPFKDNFTEWLSKELNKVEHAEILKLFNTLEICKSLKYIDFQFHDFKVNLTPHRLMSNKIYCELRNIIYPQVETTLPAIQLSSRSQQFKLSVSSANSKQKISGVYGSGKTTLLVIRAINAYKRTHKQVVILTFNVALRNYIESIILRQFGKFTRNEFYVVNYHQFIQGECGFVNLQRTHCSCSTDSCQKWLSCKKEKGSRSICFNDYQFFIKNNDVFKRKYNAIFIDEAQDFTYDWFRIIHDVFLEKYGEYVLFGDVKQNIYGRPLDVTHIKTNVPGSWNALKQCYRSNPEILDRVKEFQQKMHDLKGLSVDDFENMEQGTFENFYGNTAVYAAERDEINEIISIIQTIKHKNNIIDKNLAVIGTETKLLRNVDAKYRELTSYGTECAFAPLEKMPAHNQNVEESAAEYEKKCKNKDRPYKLHFNIGSECIKLSTIHSFKGCEAHTVVCLISETNKESEVEVIYTGLTRARFNLYIINIGETHYKKELITIFGRRTQPMN
ncbi:MAG: ATP-binding domain-containing protein [Kiritimatiellia bacterium]